MRNAGHALFATLVGFLAACHTESREASTPAGAAPRPSAVASAATPTTAMPSSTPAATPIPTSSNSNMRHFDDDLEFLKQHGAITVLEAPSGGRVAVSGKYQARVMTSAVEPRGASLGFVNRTFIEAGKTGTQFDNYGGEDRFWLGPEGGQYALYFAPGRPFQFENWQTPAAFQQGEWREKASSPSSVTFARAFSLGNYAKTELKIEVERKLSLLTLEEAQARLGVSVPSGVKWVGFASDNSITNRGSKTWTEDQGLPSIWILGMFSPAPDARIVLPFEKQASGEIVNDRYFGKVPPDRLKIDEAKGFVVFKADGQARGKIGLSPARAKAVLGSYSAAAQLLTIVHFTKPPGAQRYVNNAWEISAMPYGGDVSNAYNDGPVEPGKPSLGGFYELESSSPAAALGPGASLAHTHETYHFVGPRGALETIALKVLGVSLTDVERAQP